MININAKQIGERLALTLAKKSELKEEALKQADISIHTLKRYLAGKSPDMPFIKIYKICQVLDIDVNWLATGQTK